MQITETRNEGLIREYKVALPAAEISRKLEGRLSELAKTIKIPGFRPGKVPMSLVRQRFGSALRNEVLEQVISESSQALIKDRNLRPAATPKLSISAYEEAGDLEYEIAVEVLPDIVPPDYSQIMLERLVAEPGDDDVAEALDRLARHARQFSEADAGHVAARGDLAIVNFVGPEDRKGFRDEEGEGVPIEIGSDEPLPGVGEQLDGARVGERREIAVTFPADYAVESLRGLTTTYEVEVVGLRVAPPVAIDEELAKRFGFDNLEALKAEILRQRREDLRGLSRMRLKRALLDRLAELYSFDVPEVLVSREYENICRHMTGNETASSAGEPHVHDEGCGHDHDHELAHGEEPRDAPADALSSETPPDAKLSEEQRQEFRALAERRVRLGLVLAEVGRQSHIKVTPDELNRAIVAEARRWPGQEREVFTYFQQHGEARDALAAPILEDKVVDYIVELSQVTERQVSPADLLREVQEAPISQA
jgi:trigger factor